MEPDFYTPEEIANKVRLDVVTIRRKCASREIDADRFAGRWRISEEAFEDWRKKGRAERVVPGVIVPRRRVAPERRFRALVGGQA